MSENQPQLPPNILNVLQMFANTAWHLPSTFRRTHHSTTSRNVEYFHLQDHAIALQYLFGGAFAWYNNILVREEYREALQALQTDSSYKRGAYIIGQPGVGKTFFLVYALLERLREHKPVAVQLRASDPFYVFFTHTCTPYSVSDPALLVQEGVWALSDLGTSTTSPLGIFQDVSATMIQTTLPSIKYWEKCDRYRGGQLFVMNAWSEDEIADLASLLNLDGERMATLATTWGGVPQSLLQRYTHDESQQHWELSKAALCAVEDYATLHTLDVQDVGTTLPMFSALPAKDRAGNVCRNRYVIHVPTQTLQNTLAIALQQLESQARIFFFHAMFRHPATRTCARDIYADWLHSLIRSGRVSAYMWTNDDLHLLSALNAIRGRRLLIIRDALAVKHMNPPYYWISPGGQFPGVDCAIVMKSTVLAIQLTTYFEPLSPQVGLDELKKVLPQGNAKNNWRFRFVSISEELACGACMRYNLTGAEVDYCVIDPAKLGILDAIYPLDEA